MAHASTPVLGGDDCFALPAKWTDAGDVSATARFSSNLLGGPFAPLALRMGSLNLPGFSSPDDSLRIPKQAYTLSLIRKHGLHCLCLPEDHLLPADLHNKFRWAQRLKLHVWTQ